MKKTLLHDGPNSLIFLVEDGPYSAKVIHKIQKQVQRSTYRPQQLYELLKDLGAPGVPKVLALDHTELQAALVINYAEGKNLTEVLRQGTFSLADFYLIAISLSKTLMAIHHQGILHRDISPNNIIWDATSQTTSLIDFDFATAIRQKSRAQLNQENLIGTPAYISPEQTGRINREVDSRSDLYSLGVVFYELLTGTPPFDEQDLSALIYAQIARIPVPLHNKRPDLPANLENIVLKLLEKDAQNRYQSAAGLLHDLQKVQADAQTAFQLGEKDFPDSLHFSQKLYGRNEALQLMQTQFVEVKNGANRLILVEGGSGTGKSALVNELGKTFIESNAIFLSGKFDQYRRDTPYFAWTRALEKLITLILSSSDEQLAHWKQSFKAALGESGQVLAELIPSLYQVMGHLPPIEQLGGAEAQNRFNFFFETFLTHVCTPEKPIVVFLDDLQWADLASRQVLQMLIDSKNVKHLLLIAALRPVEEDKSGGLKQMMQDLHRIKDPLSIELGGLKKEDLKNWLNDTLRSVPSGTLELLSKLVFDKTWGNAFFSKRFIQSLYEQNLLYFDREKAEWCIQEADIAKMKMSDNVVEFMTEKIAALNAPSVQALKTAAIIGNEFETSLLKKLLPPEVELEQVLKTPLDEGYIEVVQENDADSKYVFAHDRIYQAAKEMNQPAETAHVNLQIARQLLQDFPKTQWYENAFLLASHLNPAKNHLHGADEQAALLEINRLAGLRAKASNAQEQAIRYLETALELSMDQNQQFELLLALLESYYLNAQFAESEKCAARLRAMPLEKSQRLRALQLELRLHKAKTDYPGAIRIGIEALRLVGEKLPEKPGQFDIITGFVSAQIKLRRKTPQVLLELSPIENQEKLSAVEILSELGLAAYLTNTNLLPIMTLKAVQLSAKHGNSQYSPSDYNVYGFILGQMGNFRAMRSFAEMAKILGDRLDLSPSMRSKHMITYNGLTRHWFEHPSQGIADYLLIKQLGQESGDIDTLINAMLLHWDTSLYMGAPLDGLLELSKDNLAKCISIDQKFGIRYFEYAILFLEAMQDPTKAFHFSFEEKLDAFISTSDTNGLCRVGLLQAMYSFVKGEYQAALEMIVKIDKYAMSIAGLVSSAWLIFFRGVLAALVLEKQPRHKLAAQNFRTSRKILKAHSAFNPDNFAHRKASIDALAEQIDGKPGQVPQLLRQAANEALKQKFPLDQALITWLAARAYQQVGQKEQATSLAEAAFQQFGHLHYTHFLPQIKPLISSSATTQKVKDGSSFGSTPNSNLDLTTVIKSMQTISAEVVFDKLVGNLLKLVAENAGAEKGFLLLDKKAKWLKAHHTAQEGLQLLSLRDIDQHQDLLATQIAQYSLRTGESVVLDTAYENEQFAADPYISKLRPKSVMCLPLKNQGAVMGLLYLENNLVTGAFKDERSELLTLLSSQLATSLENAYLYENLEERIAERTQQLEEEKQQSERLLLNILPAEVAQELKAKGSAEAKQYDAVSVMFTDFVNFTQVSERLGPKELVDKLDACFRAFDEIIEKYGLEKIKTVGDAYIAVCGLPQEDPDHAVKTAKAALEIRQFVEQFNEKEHTFEVRVGIHSGPVVAGIVGFKKFQYDIWGDTVNTAARMEQNSEKGKINVSVATYDLIKANFNFTPRGKVAAKNKGEIEMYFLDA